MTIDTKIVETLNTLADLIVDNYTTEVGDQPNDYFITDVARSITRMPFYSAKNKRDYIETLYGNIRSTTCYEEGTDQPLPDNEQPKAFHDAQDKYNRLAPKLEVEAMSFDALGKFYVKWFEQYTGQEFVMNNGPARPANKLTKQQQAALKAIEARRAKVA